MQRLRSRKHSSKKWMNRRSP
jgi:hypothetical protein